MNERRVFVTALALALGAAICARPGALLLCAAAAADARRPGLELLHRRRDEHRQRAGYLVEYAGDTGCCCGAWRSADARIDLSRRRLGAALLLALHGLVSSARGDAACPHQGAGLAAWFPGLIAAGGLLAARLGQQRAPGPRWCWPVLRRHRAGIVVVAAAAAAHRPAGHGAGLHWAGSGGGHAGDGWGIITVGGGADGSPGAAGAGFFRARLRAWSASGWPAT